MLSPADDSRKLRSFLDRDGWRSFRRALASICRMRSRVTAKSCPTSSRVCSQPSERPKRRRSTFASRERVEHLVRLLAQRQPDDRFHRRDDLLVLDEIAEVAVLFFADRCFERDRLLGDLENLADLVDRHFHLGGDLLRGGLAAQLL